MKIYYNGNIVTMENLEDGSLQRVEAFLVKDGEYAAVGTLEEVRAAAGEGVEEVDLQGATVTPAFVDTHMHVLACGMNLNDVDLFNATSIQECIEISKKYIADRQIPAGQWVRSRGWNHDKFTDESRFLNRYDLDKISTEHPLAYTRTCGHVIVVNSKALEIMGCSEHCDQVPGGVVEVDENGRPLGIFAEAARPLVLNAIPEFTEEQIEHLIQLTTKFAHKHGVTEIQSDCFKDVNYNFEKVLKVYNDMQERNVLKLRVYEQCHLPKVELLQAFLDAGYRTGQGNDLFKIGPYKLQEDGALGARTALMRKPYADDPSTCGVAFLPQETLDTLVEMAQKADMQIAVHAIGDGAIENVLNAVKRAQELYPREDERHGIIHSQITDLPLIKRFAEQKMVAYVQPIFLNYDAKIVNARVVDEMAKTSYAWKSFIDEGVLISSGSDCPVESLNIIENLYTAVCRKMLTGKPEGGHYPEQNLTMEEAVKAHTINAAYCSFSEDRKGSIKVGKIADFVVMDKDIFSIDPETELLSTKIMATYMDGEKVYEA